MYNYFMLIGIVEGYENDDNFYLKLKVKREFGDGEDCFKIRLFDFLIDYVKETPLTNKKLIIKGRIAQIGVNLELVAERIIFM